MGTSAASGAATSNPGREPGGSRLLLGPADRYAWSVTLSVEVSPEVLARLEAAASARGVSVEQLAADTLAQVATADIEVLGLVRDTVAEHREILDRLAET